MDIISQMRNSGVDIHRDVQVRNSHSQSWGSKFSWLTLVRLWFLGTTNIFCESGVFSSICWPDRMSQALRGVGVSKDLCYLEPSTSQNTCVGIQRSHLSQPFLNFECFPVLFRPIHITLHLMVHSYHATPHGTLSGPITNEGSKSRCFFAE